MSATKATTLEDQLQAARTTRRELEKEWSGIDAAIKDAILAGDVDLMTKLQRRKSELPMAYMKQSHVERRLADHIFGEQYADTARTLEAARADHEAEMAAFSALQERQRRELEEAQARLQQAELALASARGEHLRANEVLTGSQFGHKRAMERIASAF